jgi:hypothetical protein
MSAWKKGSFLLLCVLFAGSINGQPEGSNAPSERAVFVVNAPIRDIGKFRDFAAQIARLKPFGRIDIYINYTAEKATFEMPEGGSPWHEYAAYDRSVSKFFPDQMIAPFIPGELVEKNRQLLLSKVDVIRDLGLNAGFRSNEPHFLPAPFFEAYPHLRGPRVDHPRRSLQKEFAPCFHRQETRDMYQRMVNTLFERVPEIHTVHFNMNDAGSGFCWAEWLYSGPNGPVECKDLAMSERVGYLIDIFKNGARQKTGHEIDIFMWGMFVNSEIDDIVSHLPANCFIRGVEKGNLPPTKHIGSLAGSAYPVRGIINPLGLLKTLNRSPGKMPQRYSLGFGGSYDRGVERPEMVEKVIDIVEDYLSNPVEEGLIPVLEKLRGRCAEWAGEASADLLFRAFVELDETLNLKRATIGGLSTLYWGVSTRHITRPLVVAPVRLSPEEEAYFLPHVFNISIEEARNDYMDIHGGGHNAVPLGSADAFLGRLRNVYTSMEKIKNAPEQEFLDHMAMALRIYSSVVRSCANFNDAQIIRNRNMDALAGPAHRPDKTPTWTGDQDLQLFNEIMRNELDNTNELIDLLENGGMDLIIHAEDPALEDTFLLGPDLIGNLKQKREIMLDHWLDIEDYMTSPFK